MKPRTANTLLSNIVNTLEHHKQRGFLLQTSLEGYENAHGDDIKEAVEKLVRIRNLMRQRVIDLILAGEDIRESPGIAGTFVVQFVDLTNEIVGLLGIGEMLKLEGSVFGKEKT